MNSPQRIIDANANRVREALRVMEEAARFIIESPHLAHQLKNLRHDFTSAIKPFSDFIYHRNTQDDVGTTLTTSAEQKRSNIDSVILSAGSRLAEALRVIEEYAKLDSGYQQSGDCLAQAAKRLRYRSYAITQQLIIALGSAHRTQWRACLLLTRSLCTYHSWHNVLEEALRYGVDAVQIREKDMSDRELIAHTRLAREIINHRAALIVNDRPDIARIAGATGVHLGQNDITVSDARALLGRNYLIGVSTSNMDEATQAQTEGADYCGVGPMFPTTTKHKPVLAGLDYLKAYLASCGLPHLAIGGITPSNVEQVIACGCHGIAISSAICSSPDPGRATQSLIQSITLDKHRRQAD